VLLLGIQVAEAVQHNRFTRFLNFTSEEDFVKDSVNLYNVFLLVSSSIFAAV